MTTYQYVYGPVPSRRLGISLGVSPIPPKYCNYACVYCQLGRTTHLTNKRQAFYPVEAILEEVRSYIAEEKTFNVVTIVGEGEPTLYLELDKLIGAIKALTDKPVAVITNGALLSDKVVRESLLKADIVLPSLDATTQEIFKKVNRPIKQIQFEDVLEGFSCFSNMYQHRLWIEIMLLKGLNDDAMSLKRMKAILATLEYERLYVNIPVRPPAEAGVEAPDKEVVEKWTETLNGLCIDHLASEGFKSNFEDDYEAVMSIIKRHPMNAIEIEVFLETRKCHDIKGLFKRLTQDEKINHVIYGEQVTYRLK